MEFVWPPANSIEEGRDWDLIDRVISYRLRMCEKYRCEFSYHLTGLHLGFEHNPQIENGDSWNVEGLDYVRNHIEQLEEVGLLDTTYIEKPVRVANRIEPVWWINSIDNSVGDYDQSDLRLPPKSLPLKNDRRRLSIAQALRFWVKDGRARKINPNTWVTQPIDIIDISRNFWPGNFWREKGQPDTQALRELEQEGHIMALRYSSNTAYVIFDSILHGPVFGGAISDWKPQKEIPYFDDQPIFTLPQDNEEGRNSWDQQRMRADLIDLNPRCPITGCEILDAMEACHVRPVQKGGPTIYTNGLLIERGLHRLYDNHDISVCPDTYRLHMTEVVANQQLYEGYPLVNKAGVHIDASHVEVEYLRYHWAEFQNKHGVGDGSIIGGAGTHDPKLLN